MRKGTSDDEVIEAIERQHPEVLRADKEAIYRRGLRTIVNECFNLRKVKKVGVQGELFAEYGVGDIVSVRMQDKNGNSRRVRKALANLTKAELREYISQHEKRPVQVSLHVSEASRISRDIAPIGNDDWTVEECLKARAKTASAS